MAIAMRTIIVASGNKDSARRIKRLLNASDCFVENIFSSGADILAFASVRPDAVIICGTLPDMTAERLSELLPNGFDIISIVPSGQSTAAFRSNLISLYMPLNVSELTDTVRMLSRIQSDTPQRIGNRSQEEERIIYNAKRKLIGTHHISESQAHKILQKQSMDKGISLVRAAKLVLEERECDL